MCFLLTEVNYKLSSLTPDSLCFLSEPTVVISCHIISNLNHFCNIIKVHDIKLAALWVLELGFNPGHVTCCGTKVNYYNLKACLSCA